LIILEGTTGWITGASRGIGRATAVEAARQGASLILSARSSEGLNETALEIEQVSGSRPRLIICDVSDQNSLKAAFKEVASHTKKLDFLVNNAGILRDAILGMITGTQIEEVMRTNIFSVIHTMQFAARLMMSHKSGSIVNVASIIGRVGNEGQTVYGASKAAVLGATKSAARELAPYGIRVNAVAPGVIETSMIANIPTSKMQDLKRSIKMGRLGKADEVAKVICMLVSNYTSYVTGQVVGVDGGMWL
jgi:3-oxoacyl-[acyl-carrier protein] reductase